MPARRRRPVSSIRASKKKVVERRKNPNPNGQRAYMFRQVGPKEIGNTIPLVWIPEMVQGQRALDAKAERLRREMNASSLDMAAHHGDRIVHLSNVDYHYIPGIGYKILDRNNPQTGATVLVYYNPFNGKTFYHTTRRRSEVDRRLHKPLREPIEDH